MNKAYAMWHRLCSCDARADHVNVYTYIIYS